MASGGLGKLLRACFSSAGAAPLHPGPRRAGARAHPGRLRPPGRGGWGARGHRRLRPVTPAPWTGITLEAAGRPLPSGWAWTRPRAHARGRGPLSRGHPPLVRSEEHAGPRGLSGPRQCGQQAGAGSATGLLEDKALRGQCGSRKGRPLSAAAGDAGCRQLPSVGSRPARPLPVSSHVGFRQLGPRRGEAVQAGGTVAAGPGRGPASGPRTSAGA